ncbi:RNA polymerase sigma factor [Pedobacter sp. SYSU D00535]|uniref:RNA polymerase sigma factor n=1 Tax=Pedobacter sp. SYSU D00535 TaxID=2810308 RepID=UPI001A9643DE|nr:sigma-70 family RNA polymerase sigma factor [Pedobacter sp. SYSU D00535]
MESLDTRDLIAGIISGDKEAFSEFYNRNWEFLYQFAISRLKDTDEAKDVVQEIFVTAWLKKEQLESVENIRAYLLTMVKHETIRKISHALRLQEKITHYHEYVLPSFVLPDDHAAYKELVSILDREIENLPDRQREIYRLNKEQELSIQEIAAQLNLSSQTVKNQLGLAKKRLRTAASEAMLGLLFLMQ